MAKVLIGNFRGPQGPQGPKGDTGSQGPKGPQGATGATGAKGATGQRGSRWTQGTAITGTSTTATVFSGTGITDALVNDNYLNTSTGNTYRCTVSGNASTAKWVYSGNIKGPKGDKGDTGATGPQGPKGDTGAIGPKGDKGATGATGPQGPTGPQGIQGKKGDTGPQGPKGDTGSQGPKGPQGATGATGAKGATGQRGSRWTQGTAITGTSTTATVFSGTGITDALVNDCYLNTSTYNIYMCTVSGNASTAKWVYVCNIKGLKGDKGATGATGPQGPTGPQGIQGKKGDTGAQGPKGDTGSQGPKGLQGATGPTGAKGATGQRGSRWNKGTAITGTSTTATVFSGSGITDALVNDCYLNTSTYNIYMCTVAGNASTAKWVYVCNIKGSTGAKGATGATGAQGPKGDTGSQGPKGATGPQGPKGATGAQGPKGANGTSAAWFTGTAVTGTSTSAVTVSVSGSKAGDMYLNTSTCNVYKAITENKWVYVCNIKGAKGSDATVTVDSALSSTSQNPVQNKVITSKILDMEQGIEDNTSSIASNASGITSLVNSYNAVSSGVSIINGRLEQYESTGAISKGLANNLVTTEKGYALDARQGQELDNKITAIINSLNKKLNRNYQNIVPVTRIVKEHYYGFNLPNVNMDGTMLYCRIVDSNHCQYAVMDSGDFFALPVFRDTSKYGWRILTDPDRLYVSIYYDDTNKRINVYSNYDNVEVGLWTLNWKF